MPAKYSEPVKFRVGCPLNKRPLTLEAGDDVRPEGEQFAIGHEINCDIPVRKEIYDVTDNRPIGVIDH